MSNSLITLRRPDASDGSALHELIAACPPLDANSRYCNLLQCTHFSTTSVVAARGDDIVAAISGYLVPGREDTLFVWQVAVSESARGQGLGGRMISEILARPECSGVRYLETSVTASNDASWAMFRGFARRTEAALEESEMFEQTRHFAGELVRIGPMGKQARPETDPASPDVIKERMA